MKISDFLSPGDVFVEHDSFDKVRLLKQLSARAATRLGMDPASITDAILRREALGSTGIGAGVAIPHARIKGLKQPFGLLSSLDAPIDFDAVDGAPVDIVFLLLTPNSAATGHLNILSSVARRLMKPELRAHLRGAGDSAALYAALTASPTAGSRT